MSTSPSPSSAPVISTQPPSSSVYTYNPPAPIAFKIGLACSVGASGPGAGAANDIAVCTGSQPAMTGTVMGPFLYDLTASGITNTTQLSLNWTSALYKGPQQLPCPSGSRFAVDSAVSKGAPLISKYGYSYVSDDQSLAAFTPSGAGGVGTCLWAVTNTVSTPIISWNALYLQSNYGSGWYLVGQGQQGGVLLVDTTSGQLITLTLPDSSGGTYEAYNTVSVVQVTTITGTAARVYDSTADCASPPCNALQHVRGHLYAIDVQPPAASGASPTMQEAWHYGFMAPSGASPMVLPGPTSGKCARPCGDQIYFDGSGGATCDTSCAEDPTLFALQDQAKLGQTTAPTLLWSQDFTALTSYTETGWCPFNQPTQYMGIQTSPALESYGGQFSVWAFAACGQYLYQFDAQSGTLLQTINIPSVIGILNQNYVPDSALNTVTDYNSGHPVMFLGVDPSPSNANLYSYVVALDLVTGQELWKVRGNIQGGDATFHSQFPIAETTVGGYILIAAEAGGQNGGDILGISLTG